MKFLSLLIRLLFPCSYNFSANNDKITGSFGVPFNYPFSIVMWVKKNASQWDDPGDEKCIMVNNDTSNLNDGHGIINRGTPDELSAATWDNSGSRSQAQEPHTDGDFDDLWVCVCGTWTNDSLRNMYVEDFANSAQSSTLKVSTADMVEIAIGGATQSGFQGWTGECAEVALFSVILSEANIDAMQTGPESGPQPNTLDPSNCIGYWRLILDQATHPDESGNGGPTLTVQSNAPWQLDHPNIAGDIVISVATGPQY